ncbi:MAG: DNA-binding protein [Candidatus Omnitrophota bacterium]|nr:DNA-binding protein [Candidatus Omnitrophota bacterium]
MKNAQRTAQSAKRIKQRGVFMLIYLVLTLCAMPYALCADVISSTEILNNTKQYDGKIIAYEGEIVGDIMMRGAHGWLCIDDGKNAISGWAKKEVLKDIQYLGNYKTKGDTVRVTGVFNRSCLEHGGDLDIHVQSITKISSGNVVSHTVNVKEMNFAVGFFLVLILVYLLRIGTRIIRSQGYQK